MSNFKVQINVKVPAYRQGGKVQIWYLDSYMFKSENFLLTFWKKLPSLPLPWWEGYCG